MPTKKKAQTVEKLSLNLKNAQAVAFVNYQGLTTLQVEALRNNIQVKGGDLQIAKNTLIKLALNDQLQDENVLNGPTAIVFSFNDAVAALKELDQFISEYQLPIIKGGILQQSFISAEKVAALAKLPSRQELLAKTVGQIQAPLAGLAGVLQANLRNLTGVLVQISRKLELD